MSDALFQNFSSVQSNLQPMPVTIASTTTIAPTTRMTLVTGTIDITTVTPYVTGHHELVLVFTDATPGDLLTTGNILVGSTTITQNVPVLLEYEPAQAKYYLK